MEEIEKAFNLVAATCAQAHVPLPQHDAAQNALAFLREKLKSALMPESKPPVTEDK